MKKKLLRSLVAFSLLLGFGLTACNGGGNGDNSSQQSSSAAQQEKINITAEGGKKSLILGETVKLTASVEGVTWESKSPEVATVDQTGLVTSVSKGSASISATKEGYKGGSITITVDYETIKVTAAGGASSLIIGETLQLSADKQGVTWSSSNASIASVDDKGLVTAVGAGDVVISAALANYNNGVFNLKVTRPAATATLHMEDADHYSADGMWGTSYGTTVYGPGAESPVYARSSGNASDGSCIAYMDNGDTEILTFTSDKEVKAELVMMMAARSAVSDMGAVMNVKFNDAAIDLAGKSFEGGGDTNTFVEFSFGEVTILNGKNVLDFAFLGSSPYMDDLLIYAESSANIQVVKPTEKDPVTIDQESITVAIEKTFQITSSLEGLSYKSASDAIATVSETGLVTGVAAGSTTIAISKDGYKTIRVPVQVVEAEGVFSVSISGITGDGIATKTSQNLTAPDNVIIDTFDVDAVGTLEFNAEKAGTFEMYMKARASGGYSATEPNDLATCMELTLNGAKLTLSGEVAAGTFETYLLGEVTLNAGKNTIEIKCISAVPGINLFKFVPKA